MISVLAAARHGLASANPAARWLLAAVAGGAIHVALWWISEPPELFSDFYKANWVAIEHLWEGGLNATYPFTVKGNWSNLPIIGWLFVPLLAVGEMPSGVVFAALGYVALLATLILLMRMARPEARIGPLLLFLMLVNGPLLNSLREGNTTHFILLFLVLALAMWRKERLFAAGVYLGLSATFKPALLLFGLYFLLRGRWRIVAGGVTTILAFVLVSVAVFGVEGHVLWYQDCIEPYLGAAMAAFNVQSIDGFLARLVIGADMLYEWEPIDTEMPHRIARSVALVVLFGGALWLMLRARVEARASAGGGPTPRDLLEFSLVLVLALVTSPIAWSHYYLLLLLPMALHLGGQMPLPGNAPWGGLWRIGAVLVSLPVVMLHLEGWIAELVARTIVSAWVIGALLMLAPLARALWEREPSFGIEEASGAAAVASARKMHYR